MSTSNKKISLKIPIYDHANNQFLQNVVSGFFDIHPLLGNLKRRAGIHRGPIRNVVGDNPLDQETSPISGEAAFSTEAIRNTDFEEISMFFHNMSEQLKKGMSESFYKMMNEVTDATGMSHDFKGEKLSVDHLNTMLEGLPIEFNDTGEPKLPTIIIPPRLEKAFKNLQETEKQKQDFEEIINKKRVEFYAKKRTRRLSR